MLKQWLLIRWVQMSLAIVAIIVGTGALGLVAWWSGSPLLAVAFLSVGIMAATFIVGLALVRLILSPGHPVLAVARTLVDEAIRMKVAVVLIIVLMVIVPFMPVLFDPQERLSYRLNTFLTYSIMICSLLLSLMTIFLGCGTVANDLKYRHVFMSLTKPIGRGQYLLGKWLGIALLNLLLICVTGLVIDGLAIMMARYGRPVDELDAAIVMEEVLTARESKLPEYPGDLNQAVQAEIERRERDIPGAFLNMTPEEARQRVTQELIQQWHAIAPLNHHGFVFRGLEKVKERGGWMQLRLKPRQGGGTNTIRFRMQINGREVLPDGRPMPPIANDTYYRLPLEASLINDKGELHVAIRNQHPIDPRLTPNMTLQFEPGEGLELLVQSGTFAPNLAKGMFVLWIRLCCLGMLGLVAATFLSFPVAALFTMMVYFAAVGSAFISESLHSYAAFGFKDDVLLIEKIGLIISELMSKLAAGEIGQVFKFVLKGIGSVFMLMIPSFGDLDPVPMVSDGRVVPGEMLWDAVWKVGLLWTGLAGVIGWQIFRRRELARVIV